MKQTVLFFCPDSCELCRSVKVKLSLEKSLIQPLLPSRSSIITDYQGYLKNGYVLCR